MHRCCAAALKGSSEQSLFAYVSTSYSYTTVISTAVSYFSYGYYGGYYWWGRKMLQAQGKASLLDYRPDTLKV